MVRGDDRYLFFKKLFKSMNEKEINFETIEKLVLKFGNNYDLGEEIRRIYWLNKQNEE